MTESCEDRRWNDYKSVAGALYTILKPFGIPSIVFKISDILGMYHKIEHY